MSQLWQQQLLYKQLQLQELQRQQQQQQNQQNQPQHGQMVEMPSWQTNQPQSFPGQTTEMPSWSNMVPNPQMLFPPGNMNWAQFGMNPALMNNFQNGVLMQQNNQLQSMRNMGMVPQQLDPSVLQNSQFLAMAGNSNTTNNESMMNKVVASGAQSDAFSPYQQTVSDQGFVPDSTPQNNNNSMQNFLGGSSFNNSPARSVPPVRPTTGGSSLDPEEEKLLYGDDNWIGSFGKSVVNSSSGGGFINLVDDGGNNNNNFGGSFPSLQSGSWSALMQDALDASGSETGQNEEWSGLTVHNKSEWPVLNQSTTVPNFQQNSNQFSQNQEPTQLGNGIWGQDNSNNNNSNSHFVQRGQQGMWVPQQSRQQTHNFTNQNQAGNNNNNKPNGWNSNNAFAQTGDNNNNNNSNNGSNIYGMQPPKNFGRMNSNLSKVNQEMSAQRRPEESKQESPILFSNPNPNPNPNAMSSGGGFSPAHLGLQMAQNMGNLGMNFGANNPFGSFPSLQSQLNQQMVKSQEQRFNEKASEKREEELNSRVGIQSKDTLFNGSVPLFSQNRMGQPSQNMLELFQKAEKSPKSNPPMPDSSQSAFDTSSPNPPQNQHMQNFGLMLGPPSQRQPTKSSLDLDHHTPVPSTSSSQQSVPHTSSNSQGENTDSAQNRTRESPGTGTGTSNMFKNVWTNVSTQPHNKIITPSMIQSMMLPRANGKMSETNSVGTGTGQPEAGTSSANSAQEERQLLDKNSLNVPIGSKRGITSEENVLHGRPLNTNAQQSNYSLLNQVQSMRSTDLDAGNRFAKRLRPDHGGPVLPPVMDGNSNKTSMGPQSGVVNFVSRESEEKSAAGAPSEPADRPKVINPQMAPSWFEQYGNYRNGQNISSVHEIPQRTNHTPQFSFPKVPWSLDSNKNNSSNNNNSSKIASEQGLERSPVTPISRFGPQAIVPTNNNNSNNFNNNDNNNAVPVPRLGANEAVPSPPIQSSALTTVKEKSRKTGTRKMVPFHKVIEVPESIISTSMAEMDWAQTANRLFDKVDDGMELLEEGQLIFALSRRRLIITTKLTQHLIAAVPPRFLRAKADSSYGSIVYFVSNFALRDACSLICSSKNDSSDENNTLAERSANVEKGGEQFFTKVIEASTGRFKKLEEDFIRLNRRTSVLDLQLECQELERFSIVNRLGKFHGRGHPLTDGPDTSSGASRPFFQRAVTPLPMPKNISDTGVHCLSL